MNTREIITKTESYVRHTLLGDSSGHDWWHVYRVWKMARTIQQKEGGDLFIIDLASLLHDIGDYKLSSSREETAAQDIKGYLQQHHVENEIIDRVVDTVDNVSFSKNVHRKTTLSTEAKIVQDADRLDAIGAIGIARVFMFGGKNGRLLHDPNQKPQTFTSTEERRSANGTSINHFYEKLLLLKDLMNTDTAKQLAKERTAYMKGYLDRFYEEWEGRA